VAKTRRPRRRFAGIRYIESSALVAAMLEGDTQARGQLKEPGHRVTSSLTMAETARAIVRARAQGDLVAEEELAALGWLQEFAEHCDLLDVTHEVLERAGRPFPVEPIRTLDAIHLGTVELLGETPQRVTIITRDRRVRDNARAMGYAIA
jgi:predicted nucleic acid-binding protein